MAVADFNDMRTDCLADKWIIPLPPGDAERRALADDPFVRQANRDQWQQLTDHTLIEWGRHYPSLSDDEIIAPAPSIIRVAYQIAQAMRQNDVLAPTRVVMNGDGGVIFEWHTAQTYQTLEIESDFTMVFSVFENQRLIFESAKKIPTPESTP